MKIAPFGVEQWMNRWETRCELNLAETCVDSLTLGALMQMAGATQRMPSDLAGMRMDYGAIPGSARLRARIAALFTRQAPENILVTHGTIGANHIVYQALVGPGDRVAALVPTYQQHTAIPRSMGAEVVELPLREAAGWQPDIDALEAAAEGGLAVIALTHPNNPTGAVLPRPALDRIVAIARAAGAWILSDEVYRGTEAGEPIPSLADLYEKGISTGSMSKAFSLAGLRLGWVAGPPALLEACERHRDYTTISVGQVDDYFAEMALGCADEILDRSRRICAANRAVVADWVAAEPKAGWVPPQAGTTALIRLAVDLPSHALCERLVRETGVLLTPGSAMGMEGFVRIGYAGDRADLERGLARLGDWLARV